MQKTDQSNLGVNRRPDNQATDAGRIIIRATSAAIRLTRLTGSEDAILTKQFSLDGNGTITKQSQPHFSNGNAEIVEIESLSDIEAVINDLDTNQCISTGIFDSPKCNIVRDGDLTTKLHDQGVRSRTMKYMAQPDVGLILLDHDIGPDMPEHLKYDSPDKLMSMLCEAVPKLASVAYSGAGSCSSGITVTATGKSHQGSGGLHVYIAVQGADLKKLRRYLVINLWIKGLGYIAFARNGSMLERCIIDGSVLSQERLIYEADPVLGKGLSRRDREWQHQGGPVFSGDLSLTDEIVAEYEHLVSTAKADPKNKAKADELAATYHENRVAKLAEHKSISREEAEKSIPRQTAAERDSQERTLHPNDIVEIQGKQLSVAELLERGEEFDNVAMPDPIEGSDYGPSTAMYYHNDGLNPCIHSFAHGVKTVYRLKDREDEDAGTVENKQSHCPTATVASAPVTPQQNNYGESSSLPFPEVEPFPTPVDPALLLNEISSAIRLFIVMDDEQIVAATLWVAFTWFIDVVNVSPLAIINAPEKACGKSMLLDVMGRLSARPLPVSNASTAALFRSVELWRPTMLIDEVDTFIRENKEFKGIINAGHTRANAFVLRTVGDQHEPKRFTVWSPKALAGISLEKHLSDPTMSRGIVFNLRRKLPDESVTRIRHAEPGLFEGLASKLARFSEDHAHQVRQARPALPDELSDRAQDNWEPLLTIAGCAGPDWLRRATASALKLSCANDERASTGNELLADIQHVFISKQVEKICTKDLIAALVNDDEKPWATYYRGKPIIPCQLAKLLAPYGIKPKTVRVNGRTPKGYDALQFEDAFARYLAEPEILPQRRNDLPESNNGMAGRVADAENVAETTSTEETQEFVSLTGCGGVADVSGDADGDDTDHLPPLSKSEDDF